MKNVIDRINHLIHIIIEEFNQLSETEISNRPLPHKWSKKEVLGHLCDSAINNIERFVKIQYEKQPLVIQSYNQDQWVMVQNYQERPLEEILTLFIALNQQVINIISNISDGKLSYLFDIGNNQHMTFEWLINDYLEHMEHHLTNHIVTRKNLPN